MRYWDFESQFGLFYQEEGEEEAGGGEAGQTATEAEAAAVAATVTPESAGEEVTEEKSAEEEKPDRVALLESKVDKLLGFFEQAPEEEKPEKAEKDDPNRPITKADLDKRDAEKAEKAKSRHFVDSVYSAAESLETEIPQIFSKSETFVDPDGKTRRAINKEVLNALNAIDTDPSKFFELVVRAKFNKTAPLSATKRKPGAKIDSGTSGKGSQKKRPQDAGSTDEILNAPEGTYSE